MILPMKKYAFMVYHKEYDDFLHALREVGVVHVKENKSIAGHAELKALLSLRKQLKSLMSLFKRLNAESETADLAPARTIDKEECHQIIEKIEKLQDKRAQLFVERDNLQKKIDYMQIWGDFSYETVEKLRAAGYEITFFSCPTSRFEPKWTTEYNAFLVNFFQSVSFFVTVTKTGEVIEIDAERAKMPECGLEQLIATYEGIKDRIQNVDDEMKEEAAADYLTIEEFDKSLQNEFNFNNVVVQTEPQANEKVMLLEGWTLAEKASTMEAELDRQGYFFKQLEIQPKDKVPILLKNNRYAKLFEPLTNLFSLPNYTELDPTPLLAPFFMLFFGLCFGDSGYGLIVLLIATVVKYKIGPSDMRPYLSFAQWLGATALVVGAVISGSFFGITLGNIALFSGIKEHFMTMDRLMQFSLGLGMFHVVFGKAVAAAKIKKQKGLKHSLAPWGWVFFLAAGLVLFAPTALAMFGKPLNVPPLPMIVQYICYGIAGLSALLILFYNMPGKNIFFNFGAAIWNIYNAASGMLGDTLSYVRLFAIGLTGGILGGVFNMLGIDLTAGLPIYARIPLMLFILVFGHGLNITLCTISSLVHPLRLIFVEYFRNSEYEGGGIAYAPFKKVN